MTRLAHIDAPPSFDGVALLDATWQDYPRWHSDDAWVAFRAPSLNDPESPPYPGFAVRTRSTGPTIRTELRTSNPPPGLRRLHSGLISVGRSGVELGNAENSVMTSIPDGVWSVEIWVDGDTPQETDLVVLSLDITT